MNEFFWKHDAAIKFVLLLLFGFLALWVFVLSKNLDLVFDALNISTSSTQIKIDTCGENCQQAIDETVADAIATISALPRGSAQTLPTSKQQVTYVPLNGDFSTHKTSWSDVNNSDVSVDLAEYSKEPYIDWEATIKAVSGKAQVRLFDVTHQIGVADSDLESTSSIFATVSSGNINLWQGKNLYRVQLKSLDGSEVFFGSGKIKIVSK